MDPCMDLVTAELDPLLLGSVVEGSFWGVSSCLLSFSWQKIVKKLLWLFNFNKTEFAQSYWKLLCYSFHCYQTVYYQELVIEKSSTDGRQGEKIHLRLIAVVQLVPRAHTTS